MFQLIKNDEIKYSSKINNSWLIKKKKIKKNIPAADTTNVKIKAKMSPREIV